MVEQNLAISIIFLILLLGISFIIGYYYKWRIYTVGIGATLLSFALFFVPGQNYTWLEWRLDNLIGWSIIGFIYIFIYINNKFQKN